MIKADNLIFGYKNKTVIDGVSLSLSGGELCSVIGVNGSGKTTLVRLLDRSLRPSGGSISVDGRDALSYSPKEYARSVSRLPQTRQYPRVTVSDFIASGRYPHLGFSGRLTPGDVSALDRAVELTSTEQLLDRYLNELSGGEAQRVCFAMLLAQDTPYVLLDEPSTFLDAAGSLEITELMLKLRAIGKGVLAVSHDLSSVLKYSDKLLVIDGGRAAFYGSPSDGALLPVIERTFGVKCSVCEVDGEKEYFFKKG